jgi:bifunctional non-homologous end joining protein LigD
MSDKSQLRIGGTTIEVSNLGKVFYPKTGFTKGQIIDYYIRVSPVLLPHLKNRPITLKRYPDGVAGFFFYEKQCPPHRPEWIDTIKVKRTGGGNIDYCVMNSLPALVWAANLADLELHVFLHLMMKIEQPTALAFDLDPGAPANISDCCRTALELKKLLDQLKLESFPKTSGSKGLQVYVPLNTPVTYERTKPFAHAIALQLEKQLPELVVSNMQKALRKGKVLVDWSQNDAHKTTVCVYSLRAKERPTISTPVNWEEVKAAAKRKQANILAFEPADVLKRIEKQGDLFVAVLKLKQKLPSPS